MPKVFKIHIEAATPEELKNKLAECAHILTGLRTAQTNHKELSTPSSRE